LLSCWSSWTCFAVDIVAEANPDGACLGEHHLHR
jgi:hypothetical protein